MAVLGLILLAAAGVLTAAVVTSNTSSLSVDLWGVSVSNVTLGVVFVAGMITTVLAVVGLGMLMAGMRRGRRLRQERKSLRRENEQLAQRVESTDTPADRTYQSAPAYDTHSAPVHDTHSAPVHDPQSAQVTAGAPATRPIDDGSDSAEHSRQRRIPPRRDESTGDSSATRN